jgi:hypothetical protein
MPFPVVTWRLGEHAFRNSADIDLGVIEYIIQLSCMIYNNKKRQQLHILLFNPAPAVTKSKETQGTGA